MFAYGWSSFRKDDHVSISVSQAGWLLTHPLTWFCQLQLAKFSLSPFHYKSNPISCFFFQKQSITLPFCPEINSLRNLLEPSSKWFLLQAVLNISKRSCQINISKLEFITFLDLEFSHEWWFKQPKIPLKRIIAMWFLLIRFSHIWVESNPSDIMIAILYTKLYFVYRKWK